MIVLHNSTPRHTAAPARGNLPPVGLPRQPRRLIDTLAIRIHTNFFAIITNSISNRHTSEPFCFPEFSLSSLAACNSPLAIDFLIATVTDSRIGLTYSNQITSQISNRKKMPVSVVLHPGRQRQTRREILHCVQNDGERRVHPPSPRLRRTGPYRCETIGQPSRYTTSGRKNRERLPLHETGASRRGPSYAEATEGRGRATLFRGGGRGGRARCG